MLSKSYRNKITAISEFSFEPKLSSKGCVSLSQYGYGDFGYGDNVNSKYSVTIDADNLLKTSKVCLRQLSSISKVKYRIAVVIDGKISGWVS